MRVLLVIEYESGVDSMNIHYPHFCIKTECEDFMIASRLYTVLSYRKIHVPRK